MAVFLYKGFYIFKAIHSLVSFHMLLPSHNTNTSFFGGASFSMYSFTVFVMVSTPISGFTNPWTSKLQQSYLGYVVLLKYSLLHDCHQLYIVTCFFLSDVFFLYFTSTFLAVTDLLASILHLTCISMIRKAKCMIPPHKIHLHSYRCKMVHLLSPLHFVSVSNLVFRILQ
jgi:hypothetical protein